MRAAQATVPAAFLIVALACGGGKSGPHNEAPSARSGASPLTDADTEVATSSAPLPEVPQAVPEVPEAENAPGDFERWGL